MNKTILQMMTLLVLTFGTMSALQAGDIVTVKGPIFSLSVNTSTGGFGITIKQSEAIGGDAGCLVALTDPVGASGVATTQPDNYYSLTYVPTTDSHSQEMLANAMSAAALRNWLEISFNNESCEIAGLVVGYSD